MSLRLHPGDVVTLQTISAETQEYEGLIVDEVGQLHVPLAGDVEVGGLSLTEAEARLEEALRRFDRVVRVTVSIAEPEGHRATVLGAVTDPGVIEVAPGTRLAGLFAMAGGALREVADAEEVIVADLAGARLVRNGAVIPVSLPRAIEGDPRHNILVRPGDQLYVPPTRGERIRVLGDVGDPGVVAYRDGLRLSEALAISGGVTMAGSRRDIRVIRGPLSEPRVYVTSLRRLSNGRTHDVELAPGDIVFVTRHWIASVHQVLDALSPLISAGTTAGVTSAIILSNQD